jgi:hypothetical protein
VGDLHGWQADPYGLHEARYFSQGQPTRLVRNGDRETYDEVPAARAAMNGSAPDRGSFGGDPPVSPSTSAMPAMAPSPAAGLDPPPSGGQLQGWEADPYRRHVHRYFIEGRPTVHVSDGGPVFEDDPAATASVGAPGEPSQRAQTAVGVWSLDDVQPEGWGGEPYPRHEEGRFEDAPPTDRYGGRDDLTSARPPVGPPVASDTLPETRGLHSVRSRGPEPGWYAGVSGTPGLHFWDGVQWTEHTWQDPLAHSTTMEVQEIPISPADLGPRAPVAGDPSIQTLVEQEGWRSDHLGRHQYRYFAQGQPTAHVSDSGHLSQDDPLRGAVASTGRAEDPRPTPSLSRGSVLQGWETDPYGRHELRYFSDGKPTGHVCDAGVQSDDPPPEQEGWKADPYDRHEFRYFKHGRPTRVVSNGGRSFDDDGGPG